MVEIAARKGGPAVGRLWEIGYKKERASQGGWVAVSGDPSTWSQDLGDR